MKEEDLGFKNYPREYERVFTGNDLIKTKCDLELLGIHGEWPKSNIEYMKLFRQEYDKFYGTAFDALVRVAWLGRKFVYRGYLRKHFGLNNMVLDRAWGVFMRAFVGIENRFTMNSTGFSKVITYFDDFFPNFDEGNPFEEKYEYPFKHMTLDCLVTVYQMPNRIALLKYGDAHGMGYTEFLDFVLNYISCYNEEHGETFRFIFSNSFMPYIKYVHRPRGEKRNSGNERYDKDYEGKNKHKRKKKTKARHIRTRRKKEV